MPAAGCVATRRGAVEVEMDTVGVLALALGGVLVLGAAIWAIMQAVSPSRADSEDHPPARLWSSPPLAPPPPHAQPTPPPPAPPAPPPPPTVPDDVPTLSVVALGVTGVGKTVLLASMARALRPAAERRYYLDCDLEQSRLLANLHSQVRDTSAPWPLATRPGDEHEFLFDCKTADDAHVQRTVFRLSFFDYPGDGLDPSGQTGSKLGLQARVDNAHALLVILDGRRVAMLGDDGKAHPDFEDQLWPMLAVAHRAMCPVQLIVTKWDLVQSANPGMHDDDLLRKVWRQLAPHQAIKQLVHAHCLRGEEVRLIPVSAVGPRFAQMRPDGTVVKRSDGVLEPMNVAVPFSAVIPSLLRRLEWSLEPSLHDDLHEVVERVRGGALSTMVISVLDSRVGILLRDGLAVLVGDFVVTSFVAMLVRGRSRAVQSSPAGGDDEAQRLPLRLDVIDDMEMLVDEFEEELPGSILCRRRAG